jgi:hypothetical protein
VSPASPITDDVTVRARASAPVAIRRANGSRRPGDLNGFMGLTGQLTAQAVPLRLKAVAVAVALLKNATSTERDGLLAVLLPVTDMSLPFRISARGGGAVERQPCDGART